MHEFVNSEGKTCIVLDNGEAAVVCGDDGIRLYLHQENGAVVESKANTTALAMAQEYGDIDHEIFYGYNGPIKESN